MPDFYKASPQPSPLPEPSISKLSGSTPYGPKNTQTSFRIPDDPRELKQLIFMHSGMALIELDRCMKAFKKLEDVEAIDTWKLVIEQLEQLRQSPYASEPKEKP